MKDRTHTTGDAPNRGLHWLAVAVVLPTFLLLIVGALVTSNEAGDSVPDWPMSFGRWVVTGEQFVAGVRYEYSHRFIAGVVGVVTFLMWLWALKTERRPWLRRLAGWAFLGVVAQAALGGVRVLLGETWKPYIAVPHALAAQSFLGVMVAIAVFASQSWAARQSQVADTGGTPLRRLTAITVGVILLQLVLGAGFRHRAFGSDPYLAIVPHVLGAVAVIVMVWWTVREVLRRHRADAFLRKPALAVAGLTGLQVVLGVCAYLARLLAAGDPQPLEPMISLTVAHVFIGALTLAATVTLMLRCYRALAPAGQEARAGVTDAPEVAAPARRAAV